MASQSHFLKASRGKDGEQIKSDHFETVPAVAIKEYSGWLALKKMLLPIFDAFCFENKKNVVQTL